MTHVAPHPPAATTARDIEARYTSGTYAKQDFCFVRGHGTRLWDAHGTEYLDFAAGIGTCFLGHCHKAVVDAIQLQATKLISCTEIYYTEARAALYEQLAAVTPDHIARFFLTNSGTEAIEGALKFARLLTKKTDFVAFTNSFHGRSMGALSATGKAAIRDAFGPLLPGVAHVAADDPAALDRAVTDRTAAVLFECVQGEGGVVPISAHTADALKAAQKRGALLIADEIQTGFGRTGRWFACEHFGLEPDLLAMAKALGAGVPIGAIGIAERLGPIPATMHGSTYGGTPLTCAAATAAIQTLRDLRAPDVAESRGAAFMRRLAQAKFPAVKDVRGMGLMIGLDLVPKVADIIKQLATERRFLALKAGENVLRLLPPVVATADDFDAAFDHLKAVLG